ncbi:MAG TPA: non-homologous end-joining DNA ligase [Gemmatimonadales bacterium]|jgi:DNA ligase D-like protein (predicted ligase)
MLATLAAALPGGDDWIYEPKLDGIRALVYMMAGTASLFSRNHKRLDAAYPELVEGLSRAVRGDAVLDGEIVAIDPRSRLSSFSRLQRRSQLRDADLVRESGVRVKIYLFDCLFSEGVDLTRLPLIERKSVLRDVVHYDDDIVFTPFRTRGAAEMFRRACARGAEGILAKRAASTYVSARSIDWLKIKCINQQEFVIGGYTPPRGARERLGALLVGYYDGDALRYAGKVGTGYDRDTLELLHRQLSSLRRQRPPFAPGPLPSGPVTWVAPRLVAEVGFSEWTSAGLLRHPRYLGLREDKAARDVHRQA